MRIAQVDRSSENQVATDFVAESFGDRAAALGDSALDVRLPARSWGEFAQAVARKTGFASAMMGAGLGLTGFGGVGEQKAEAGIVISFDPNADQRAKDNGAVRSVAGGGNVGSITVHSELGSYSSSLVFINPFTAIKDAHAFDSRFGLNQSYSIGTGANYNSGPYMSPANIFIHPDYGGAAGRGVDLAVITFNIPVAGVSELEFASGRSALNETLWLAGYGVTGSPDRGYLGQDGFIRAGTSIARNSAPLLGGSSSLYQNLLFDDVTDNLTGLRGGPGDSGGGIFKLDGKLAKIIIGGSTDITGSTSMGLLVSAPTVVSFIDQHKITAVPEPSSLSLLGGLAVASAAYRAYRRLIPRKNC